MPQPAARYENYRPIPYVNVNLKKKKQHYANRLDLAIDEKNNMHHDQIEFILGM